MRIWLPVWQDTFLRILEREAMTICIGFQSGHGHLLLLQEIPYDSWRKLTGLSLLCLLPSSFTFYVAFSRSALLFPVWNHRYTDVYMYYMHLFLKDLKEMEDYVPFFSSVLGEDRELLYKTAARSKILTRRYTFYSKYYLQVLKYILKLANIKIRWFIVAAVFMVAFGSSFSWNYGWSWLRDMHLPIFDVVKDIKVFWKGNELCSRKNSTENSNWEKAAVVWETKNGRSNLKKGEEESGGSSRGDTD